MSSAVAATVRNPIWLVPVTAMLALLALASLGTGRAAASTQFLTSWGYTPYDSGKFVRPIAIASGPTGDIYVADTDTDWSRIERFDSDGNFIDTFGSQGTGAGQLSNPTGVALDGAGNVYVAERDNNRVSKFDSSGDFVRAWGFDVGGPGVDVCTSSCQSGTSGSGAGGFASPNGIAFGGGNVYVTDTGRVQRFDTDGTYLSEWGSSGSAEEQFMGALSIAVAPGGDVYVADDGAERVQQFSSSGTFVRMWGWGVNDGTSAFQVCTSGCEAGIAGAGAGQLDTPVGLVASDSMVLVAEQDNNRVSDFSPTGSFTSASGYGVLNGASEFQTCTTSCQTGIAGGNAGQFDNPHGVALSSGGVYIADTSNHRVQKIVPSPPSMTSWGRAGGNAPGEIGSPAGLATDGTGNVYMADPNNNRITKYSNSGSYLLTIGSVGTGPGELIQPRDVAVDADGYVYVADTAGSEVVKYDSSGNYVMSWGSPGSGDGQFSVPYGIAVGPTGNVYVLDRGNARVQKFDSSGGFITKWGSTGSGPGQFDNPTGITVGVDDSVFVVDPAQDRVQRFTADGDFLTVWGTTGTANGQLNTPLALEASGSNSVWVADSDNHRLQQFTYAGAYLQQVGSEGHGPGQFDVVTGITTDCRGNVFASDNHESARIEKFGDPSAPAPPCSSNGGDGGGSGGGNGGGAGPAAIAPTLKIRLHPSRFRTATKKKGPRSKSKRRRKTGSKLTYTLSEAATVRFTVQKQIKGRIVRGKCKAQVKRQGKRARGKRCKAYKTLGSFSARGVAGSNQAAFTGKLGRKTLRAGVYRLAAQATSQTNLRSKLTAVSFRVLR